MTKAQKRKGGPRQGHLDFTASEALGIMYSNPDWFSSPVPPRADCGVALGGWAISRRHRHFPALFWQDARGNVQRKPFFISENFGHAWAMLNMIDPLPSHRGE
jgi:hypothetical protein